MQNITLQPVPNQQFTIGLDSDQWDITLKTTNGTLSVSLSLNGVQVIENLRAVSNMRIIPAIYQESGNFAIISQNQNVPDYTQFGVTQFLVYISPDELVIARAPLPAIVTADIFDPAGGLPLRFKPQGYVLAS